MLNKGTAVRRLEVTPPKLDIFSYSIKPDYKIEHSRGAVVGQQQHLGSWLNYDASLTLFGPPEEIRSDLSEIKDELRKISAILHRLLSTQPERVDTSSFTEEELTLAIREFFTEHDGENVYPSDVAIKFCIDYDRAVEAIQRLEADGKIKKVE